MLIREGLELIIDIVGVRVEEMVRMVFGLILILLEVFLGVVGVMCWMKGFLFVNKWF